MTPNPIRKVLSTIRQHQVKALLMGGQACVFYGAAEFNRNVDFAILSQPDNLHSLQAAMNELAAEVIAVPTFEASYLEKGHAVHFRCGHPDANGLRVDVMTRMRGVDPFPVLWERRTTMETTDGEVIDLMALPDLVQAKKTQRDKDWPMIRRLLEAHYAQNRDAPSVARRQFWVNELRTPILLREVLGSGSLEGIVLSPSRNWLANPDLWTEEEIGRKIAAEEAAEREADRRHWAPLKQELERLRHAGK